jgi:SagB-type dehydrogenase family enzyme
MDLGHVCQNVQLAATAMDLGSCPIGAFYDDDINELLGVDGEEETVLYLVTVGKL